MVHSSLGELHLPLEGLVDVAAEKARLTKALAKADVEIGKFRQKLANPNFTAKAPPHVPQEQQQRLAEWQTKRGQLQAALDRLGAA